MTTTASPPRLLWRRIPIAVLGRMTALFGYDQEVAYNGQWDHLTGPPEHPSGLLRLYPWFYDSIWPGALVFAVGSAVLVGALIAIRLSFRPALGGHLAWLAVGVAGTGVTRFSSGLFSWFDVEFSVG